MCASCGFVGPRRRRCAALLGLSVCSHLARSSSFCFTIEAPCLFCDLGAALPLAFLAGVGASAQVCYRQSSSSSPICPTAKRSQLTALATGLQLGPAQAPPNSGSRCTQPTMGQPASASAVPSPRRQLRRSRRRRHRRHHRRSFHHRLRHPRRARPLCRRPLPLSATAAGQVPTSAQASPRSGGSSTQSMTAPNA